MHTRCVYIMEVYIMELFDEHKHDQYIYYNGNPDEQEETLDWGEELLRISELGDYDPFGENE